MVTVPNNPRESRAQAQLYAALASAAEIAEDREHFASLAEGWTRLAAEIEDALGLLNAPEQIEVDEPKYFDDPEYSEAA